MQPIRVLLAEDQCLVRAAFRTLLESLVGIEVIAGVDDGRQAIEHIKAQQPDVVLMDIDMPMLNGLDATAQISRLFPKVRVIILTMHKTGENVLQAIQAGAAGYLLKFAEPTELEQALHAVAKGQTYLGLADFNGTIEEYHHYLALSGHRMGAVDSDRLTLRQREVLQLVAEGHASKHIAAMLGISLKTVEAHRHSIMERLDIHDLAGLVRYAIRMGVATSD